MKIALIRRSFSAVGGAELYLQRLLAALQNRGHEIHLISEFWPEVPKNVTLHPIAVSGSRAQRGWAFARAVQEHLVHANYDCVFSLERTLRQDVYRAGDGLHRMWVRRRGKFSPWWRRIWTGRYHREMVKLEQQVFEPSNTRYVIANSEMVRREILANFAYPPERIILVRNGVDVARFQHGDRAGTRKRFNLAEDDFVCLFVGSGWERKGLNYLVNAVRELSHDARLKLLIVGKGRSFCRDQNVIFAGPQSRVEDFYAAADLFTFVPIYEPSANVCIEALAAGLPVITSAYNGASELITSPELGEVLPDPSNVSSLAEAIQKRMAQKQRVKVPVETLSLERNVRETLSVLEMAAATR